ncbi:Probable shikimate-5-dehydrogenase (AroE) [Mycobacteroides abscessus]|nr:Probable shikimate-5-dehydrogenase (AroE) [Mycobacteroides abscessus]
MRAEIRRAAVLGSPIGHSRSPDLHVAAYRELGLTGWTYERIECTAEQLPDVVGGAGPEWVGFSVTMPGKFAALRFASTATDRARSIGAANTRCAPVMVGMPTTPTSTGFRGRWPAPASTRRDNPR